MIKTIFGIITIAFFTMFSTASLAKGCDGYGADISDDKKQVEKLGKEA